MIINNTKYNGWTNWTTWNCMLWLNEKGMDAWIIENLDQYDVEYLAGMLHSTVFNTATDYFDFDQADVHLINFVEIIEAVKEDKKMEAQYA
tara:strand:- start:202 stop:474 length:273 start_codon:yes stop_codon:yes gene_type:complete